MAYGTDKHDDYYAELAAKDGDAARDLRSGRRAAARRPRASCVDAGRSARRNSPTIRDRLAALEPRLAATAEEAR